MAADLSTMPSVTSLLAHDRIVSLTKQFSRSLVLNWIREAVAAQRILILENTELRSREAAVHEVVLAIELLATRWRTGQIKRVINATGIVLHTGLGRASLCDAAIDAIVSCARASNVELNLQNGERAVRGEQLTPAWKTLTGCEDSLIVNNNAAATLLTLQSLCAGREVVISRGQLIEIGGSFRLPDIFELSGAKLREVGTTNRTRIEDYATAIHSRTAAILRVHPSNYEVVGFSETPQIQQLTELAHRHNLIMIDDIGSGCLHDITRFGLPREPTFQESIAAGADVVLGSGDKLLGGPQCGIILGNADLLQVIRKHPLARTVRVDKLALAAMSATLGEYLADRAATLPIFQMLTTSLEQLVDRANRIVRQLQPSHGWEIALEEHDAEVGGGSLPGLKLQTIAISIGHRSINEYDIAVSLRTGTIPVVPRIQKERVLIDLRSVQPEEDGLLSVAVQQVIQ
jgi:L-seryl-tRNA(Ser) seleniumtransferase